MNRELPFLELKWGKLRGLFFFGFQSKLYPSTGCWMKTLWKSVQVVGEQVRICQMQSLLTNCALTLLLQLLMWGGGQVQRTHTGKISTFILARVAFPFFFHRQKKSSMLINVASLKHTILERICKLAMKMKLYFQWNYAVSIFEARCYFALAQHQLGWLEFSWFFFSITYGFSLECFLCQHL